MFTSLWAVAHRAWPGGSCWVRMCPSAGSRGPFTLTSCQKSQNVPREKLFSAWEWSGQESVGARALRGGREVQAGCLTAPARDEEDEDQEGCFGTDAGGATPDPCEWVGVPWTWTRLPWASRVSRSLVVPLAPVVSGDLGLVALGTRPRTQHFFQECPWL